MSQRKNRDFKTFSVPVVRFKFIHFAAHFRTNGADQRTGFTRLSNHSRDILPHVFTICASFLTCIFISIIFLFIFVPNFFIDAIAGWFFQVFRFFWFVDVRRLSPSAAVVRSTNFVKRAGKEHVPGRITGPVFLVTPKLLIQQRRVLRAVQHVGTPSQTVFGTVELRSREIKSMCAPVNAGRAPADRYLPQVMEVRQLYLRRAGS